MKLPSSREKISYLSFPRKYRKESTMKDKVCLHFSALKTLTKYGSKEFLIS